MLKIAWITSAVAFTLACDPDKKTPTPPPVPDIPLPGAETDAELAPTAQGDAGGSAAANNACAKIPLPNTTSVIRSLGSSIPSPRMGREKKKFHDNAAASEVTIAGHLPNHTAIGRTGSR